MTKQQWLAVALGSAFLAACPPSKNSPGSCSAGQTSCSGACTSTQTDAKNCGACGTACPSGQSCAGGSCSCPSGQTVCGALCVTTASDALNCGGCGQACRSGENCADAGCVCQAGLTQCGSRCVDLHSDVGNCGSCGTACSSSDVCFAGSCTAYCGADAGVDAGLADCGGSCVNLANDVGNCGGCGQACAPGQHCGGSQCGCPSGQTLCDAGCADVSQSQQNCGACGKACESWQLCRGGSCVGPDLMAACSNYDVATAPAVANSVVGVDSATGQILVPPQPVAAPPPDGGSPLVPQIASLLYTDAHTLWVLDTTNDQIDVLDVTTWPATVKGSVAVGTAPNQLLLCGGLVVVLNSTDSTVQGVDPTSLRTVAEVNLGAGENPEYATCDGAHTLYVTDWQAGDVKSIDVSQATWTVGHTLLVPAADVAALPDGGSASPTPGGIAWVAADAGAEVWVSLENLDPTTYAAVGPSTVLVMDPALSGVTATIDPGSGCLDAQVLTADPARGQVYETCTGNYSSATGVLAPIAAGTRAVGPLVTLPLGSPTPTAVLANGLVAVGDWGGSGAVALWNPADGGVGAVVVCPTVDGGQIVNETVAAVVSSP